jgi:hypothetical protein
VRASRAAKKQQRQKRVKTRLKGVFKGE